MSSLDPIERHLFLEGIFLRYGYDFRDYAEVSLTRRLNAMMVKLGEKDGLLAVLKKILESNEYFRKVLQLITVGTSEFFRDPEFFKTLRESVIPVLKTYPTINIWIAGCSTGEEVVSIAILLKEEGLLNRATIYATDINPEFLRKARSGIFDLESVRIFAKNYTASGGKASPSDYYTAEYGLVKFDPKLFENVVFSEHNLATDAVFTEAHLILCRNVLIYFDRILQSRAFHLFSKSLIYKGFLGIGSKESIRFSPSVKYFDDQTLGHNIFQLKVEPDSIPQLPMTGSPR